MRFSLLWGARKTLTIRLSVKDPFEDITYVCVCLIFKYISHLTYVIGKLKQRSRTSWIATVSAMSRLMENFYLT